MQRGIKKVDVQIRKFFSISEVAKRWGVSESTIRRMIDRGEIVTIRIGNSVRISIDEITKHESGE